MVSKLFPLSLLGASLLLLSPVSLFAQYDTIKASTTFHPDGTQTNSVFDPEKRTTEETTLTKQGKVLRKVIYLLDDRNQPLGAVVYDGKGTVLYRSSYKRDGMGRIDEENVSSNDGKPLRRRVYTYGGNNKIARVDEFDPAGNLIVQPSKTNQSRGRRDKKR